MEWTGIRLPDVALKIPLVVLLWIVWWAVRADARRRPSSRSGGDGGTQRRRHPRGPLPRRPRRGPHGDPAPAAPPRVRSGRSARGARSARPLHAASAADWQTSRPMTPTPTSVLSDGTILRPRRRGPHQDRPVGPGARPAGERRPAARRLVPRLPQPPHHGDRPARAAGNLTEEVRIRAGERVRDPPRRVLPRPHAGVGRAAGRHRRADRGQVLARPPRADRPRDGRLLRPGLEGHADAGAQQPHARPDQALPRPADRPALVHDARPRRRSGPTAAPSSAATTRARARRPRAATSRHAPSPGVGRPACPAPRPARGLW